MRHESDADPASTAQGEAVSCGHAPFASITTAAMSARPPKRPLRASTGPSPMLVQRAGAVLVIDRLLPGAQRPLQADVKTLERFSALMATEGFTAHVSALAFD